MSRVDRRDRTCSPHSLPPVTTMRASTAEVGRIVRGVLRHHLIHRGSNKPLEWRRQGEETILTILGSRVSKVISVRLTTKKYRAIVTISIATCRHDGRS